MEIASPRQPVSTSAPPVVQEESMPNRICRIMQGTWPFTSQVGTGFMIADHVLMTSALVLTDKAVARKCVAQFSIENRDYYASLEPDSLFIRSSYIKSETGKPILVWKSQPHYAYTIVAFNYSQSLPLCYSLSSIPIPVNPSFSVLVWHYSGGTWRTNSSLGMVERQAKQTNFTTEAGTDDKYSLIELAANEPSTFDAQSFGAPAFLKSSEGLELCGILVDSGSIVRIQDIKKHLACEGHLFRILHWDPKVSGLTGVFNAGCEAYNQGKWVDALAYLERAARQGDPLAHFLTAQAYLFLAIKDSGGTVSESALQLFLDFVKDGWQRLGGQSGADSKLVNLHLANEWYEKTISLYEASKNWKLPSKFWDFYYSKGCGYSLLTESRIGLAKVKLAILYMKQGSHTPKRAMQLLSEAHLLGYRDAKVIMAHAYFLGIKRGEGWVLPENSQRGFQLLKDAAEHSDVTSYTLNRLAECYEKGTGTSVDRYRARECRQKASEKGATGTTVMLPSEVRRQQLQSRVIGQPTAVNAALDAINIALMSELVKRRPSVLYFPGPSGVGKTELAKAIADVIQRDLLRFDMAEYSSQIAAARFIGTEVGYKGFGKTKTLVDRVCEKPKAVVLFDEIDKAHSSVLKCLYGVLDEGRLTAGTGKVADFTQTIIVMTSNLGDNEIASLDWNREETFLRAHQVAIKLLSQKAGAAFVGRIGAIIPFRPLSTENLKLVMRAHVQQYIKETREQFAVELQIDESVWLPKLMDSPQLGARHAILQMENTINGLLAAFKSDDVLRPNDRLTARRREGQVILESR